MIHALLLMLTLGIAPVGTSIVTAADGSLQCRATGDIELTPDRNRDRVPPPTSKRNGR